MTLLEVVGDVYTVVTDECCTGNSLIWLTIPIGWSEEKEEKEVFLFDLACIEQ